MPKLFTLPLLAQVNKYVLVAYWRNEGGGGGGGKEGVTLRWTIWTNIPLRGEYASLCKNLVRLLLYGFSSGMSEPQGDWKKKRFYPRPPPLPSSPFLKTKGLQPAHFKSLAAPPLPTAWETFSPSLFLGLCPTK